MQSRKYLEKLLFKNIERQVVQNGDSKESLDTIRDEIQRVTKSPNLGLNEIRKLGGNMALQRSNGP